MALKGLGRLARRDNAWFIAFAPYDDPRYAMSVLVEHGGFGAEASGFKAAQIMRVAPLKDPEVRARIVSPLPYAPAPPPDSGAGVEGRLPPRKPDRWRDADMTASALTAAGERRRTLRGQGQIDRSGHSPLPPRPSPALRRGHTLLHRRFEVDAVGGEPPDALHRLFPWR